MCVYLVYKALITFTDKISVAMTSNFICHIVTLAASRLGTSALIIVFFSLLLLHN